jgi:DNA polymerase
MSEKCVYPVGEKISVIADSAWLLIKLPSGRLLTYARPRLVNTEMPWSTPKRPAWRDVAWVEGENSMTRQWERYSLWGGFLTENVVQAVARDLLAEAMRRMDAEGINVVLTVHDEVVCEVSSPPQVERMREIMMDVPAWARGIPIAVEGWTGARFQK